MEVSSDGYFRGIWSVNTKGENVYPYLKAKRGSTEQGFDVTFTDNRGYHLVGLEGFLDLLARGEFDEGGRVRMKPESGGPGNGFSVRRAQRSTELNRERTERRARNT